MLCKRLPEGKQVLLRCFEHADMEHTPVILQHRGAFPRWEFLLVYIQKFDGKLIFPWVVSLHPDIFMVRYAHGWLVMIGLLFLLACWVRSILTSFPFDHTPEDHICSTTSRWSEWSLWFLHLSISNDNVHDRPCILCADRFELYGFRSAPDAELSTCLTQISLPWLGLGGFPILSMRQFQC